MKRVALLLILLLLVPGGWALAQANSAPSYWVNYPTGSLLAVSENSPIRVDGEDLTFDFRQEEGDAFSPLARVTAAYAMTNSQAQRTVSAMAFPYIGNLWETEENIQITADGEEIPYRLYYGEEVNPKEGATLDFDLDAVLAGITKEPYVPKGFSLDDPVTLHRIILKVDPEESLKISVKFSGLTSESFVLAKDFGGYSFDGQEGYELLGWKPPTDSLDFALWGAEVEYTVEVFYSEEKGGEKLEADKIQVDETVLPLGEYLQQYLASTLGKKEGLTPQAFDVGVEGLEKALAAYGSLVTEDFLLEFAQRDRYKILVYEVPFEGYATRNVTVSYDAKGTMDRRNTTFPLHTYRYLLSPAARWGGFQDLQVTILPQDSLPFVLESNLPLTRNQEGIYEGSFAELPDTELSFTLSPKEKVTYWDRVKGDFSHRFGYLGVLAGLFLLGFLMLTLIILLGRKFFPDYRS